MNRKAQAGGSEGISLETLTKILLGALFTILIFGGSLSLYKDEGIHHIHATKAAALTVDALSSIRGDAYLPLRFLYNVSVGVKNENSRIEVAQQPFTPGKIKYSSISLPEGMTLVQTDTPGTNLVVQKRANAILLENATRDFEQSCPPSTGFSAYNFEKTPVLQEYMQGYGAVPKEGTVTIVSSITTSDAILIYGSKNTQAERCSLAKALANTLSKETKVFNVPLDSHITTDGEVVIMIPEGLATSPSVAHAIASRLNS